jgi:hypothetical protein
MNRPANRHYSEEEILMHILGEEDSKEGAILAAHLGECQECRLVLLEYQRVLEDIRFLRVDEIPAVAWLEQKERLMAFVRDESRTSFREIRVRLGGVFVQTWNYAIAHPLPALGYIALALALASQSTISIFRLDHVLPTTGDVIQVLKLLL